MTELCGDVHCVTCSDEGVPMLVLDPPLDGLTRCVGEDGSESEVMTALVGDVQPGDVVLVHAGTALTVTANSERRA